MNKELQEHIEVAKAWAENRKQYMGYENNPRDKTLLALISCAEELEAIKSASDELPKKKEVGCFDYKYGNSSYNQAIEDCTPIHQKQVLRIKELEHRKFMDDFGFAKIQALQAELTRLKEELAWWHNLINKHHNNETCPNLKTYVENLQKENTRLKQKEELDVGKIEKLIAATRTTYWGHNLDKALATTLVSRFSLVNKELLGALKVSNEALVIASHQFKHIRYGRDEEYHMDGCAMCSVEKAISITDKAISKIEKEGI